MLISRVSEEECGTGDGQQVLHEAEDNSHEYQTASELFEIMAKNQNFQPSEDESLTTRDLVLLYKNIELGTKLMSKANECKRKQPNQYVETVVYNEDPDSDSDISEIYSNEDLHTVVSINRERIDLLNNPPSLEKTLCHKLSDFKIKSSNFTADYERAFLFQDPYVKEQLQSLNLLTNSHGTDGSILPASLLDYICCKRLEDNYDFYMENVIRYVKHTIEQLKRISNGDYLTEIAKEKWREVNNHIEDDKNETNNTKVLANSTSIPLHVERKVTGHASTWNDIVHSEVNVRYLSKILEKKIVLEVPSMICGSYRLFSKCYADNLIISYKKEKQAAVPETVKDGTRVDVIFQLQRSESGHVMSNISSIMFLQKSAEQHCIKSNNFESCARDVLPLLYKEQTNQHSAKEVIIENKDFNNDIDFNAVKHFNEKTVKESDVIDNIFKGTNKTIKENEVLEDENKIREETEITEEENHLKEAYLEEENNFEEGYDFTDEINFETENYFNQDVGIVELDDNYDHIDCTSEPDTEDKYNTAVTVNKVSRLDSDIENTIETIEYDSSSRYHDNQASSESSDIQRGDYHKKRNERTEAAFDLVAPDELRLAMQRLNMQSSLPEESLEDMPGGVMQRKISPVKNRIKSPYENMSFVIEERKRKKLLEIRKKREKRKMAMSENCKVAKPKKNLKVSIMPQPSSSVTKLSITNKSFYNSIYGPAANATNESKQPKMRGRIDKKDAIAELSSDCFDPEEDSGPIERQKYINRSYFLDDTVTEMMYMQMKHNETNDDVTKEVCSESNSVESNDFSANLKILTRLIAPSIVGDSSISTGEVFRRLGNVDETLVKNERRENLLTATLSKSVQNVTPINTPKDNVSTKSVKNEPIKSGKTVEFRKSIDKIYDLMKQLGKTEDTDSKPVKSKFTASTETQKSSTIQCSDSGTSVKHHLTSSNPSCFSFEKSNSPETVKTKYSNSKKSETPTAVVPKVIISTKSQTPKPDGDRIKRDRKRNTSSPKGRTDNPLKAISQLLHEFDNVQKTRQKSTTESKLTKKPDSAYTSSEVKTGSRQSSYRRQSQIPQSKESKEEQIADKYTKGYASSKERRPRPGYGAAPLSMHVEDKHPNRFVKRQVVDIVDEFKEARGEAVRERTKPNARLNSLAQPKRSYVQAHIEEYQTRFGRSLVSDRLQKLAVTPMPQIPERNAVPASCKYKQKRSGVETMSGWSFKQPPPPAAQLLERRVRTSTNNDPDVATIPSVNNLSSKQNNVPESPDSLKKKMVAVESYVKNHYGRGVLTDSSEDSRSAHKSRVPLIPRDIELVSESSSHTVEESTVIGKKLKHIIDTMTPNAAPSPTLTVVVECNEGNYSKNSKDDLSLAQNLSREIAISASVDSDYDDSVFDDRLIDRRSIGKSETENVKKTFDSIPEETNGIERFDISTTMQTFSSATELQKLESALYRRMSLGTFQKRLRIKNLTLTPKQSMQQVFVLQSGDVGSVLLKSTLSQNLKINNSKSDTVPNTQALPGMTKSHLDWSFPNFPMTIAAVGYAFPKFQSVQCGPNFRIKSVMDGVTHTETNLLNRASSQTLQTSNKTSQYIKRGHNESSVEPAGSDHLEGFLPISSEITVNPFLEEDKGLVTTKLAKPIERPENTILSEEIVNNVDKPESSSTYSGNRFKKKESKAKDAEKVVPSFNDNHSEKSDCTTSLDILVGLLNEIQKITTCQTHITSTNTNDTNHDNNKQSKELDSILNNAAIESSAQKSCRDVVSITSLDNLRQLESNPSIYSFYLSNDEDRELNEDEINTMHAIMEPTAKDMGYIKPILVDKGVNADFLGRELVNSFTDAPSRCFPATLNCCTSVSNSLLGVLSQPSSQSIFTFNDNQQLYHPLNSKKYKEFSQDTATEISQSAVSQGAINNLCLSVVSQNATAALSPSIVVFKDKEVSENSIKEVIEKKRATNISTDLVRQNIASVKHKKINKNLCIIRSSDLDPVMKMKRDILVTVYSILVFTVFAALSFPEMLYHA